MHKYRRHKALFSLMPEWHEVIWLSAFVLLYWFFFVGSSSFSCAFTAIDVRMSIRVSQADPEGTQREQKISRPFSPQKVRRRWPFWPTWGRGRVVKPHGKPTQTGLPRRVQIRKIGGPGVYTDF